MTKKNISNLLFAFWLYTIIVILWGAWVRISHSGNGCGDHWPLCGGEFIPTEATAKTWIEYSHRMMSGLYGLIVFYGIAVNLLFSFHELFLYYILQPFDRDGNTKNPIFTMINGIFYYFCIQNYQLANRFKQTTSYVLIISIIIVVYVSLGLIIVKLKAPKQFKLK